jgi:hypothetical protein
MDGRAADETGFGSCRSGGRRRNGRRRSLNAGWGVGQQLVESVERGAVGCAAYIQRWTFHFGGGGQVRPLFADFAECWRWLDHHHAAAFGAG